MQTLQDMEDVFQPLESVINSQFPTAVIGHDINDIDWQLMALPPKLGGLGI